MITIVKAEEQLVEGLLHGVVVESDIQILFFQVFEPLLNDLHVVPVYTHHHFYH